MELKSIITKLKKCIAAAAAAKSLQSCPTLCNSIDSSPPGSPGPGILKAGILEWVAISFSNAWKWKVKVKSLSCAGLLATPWTAGYQASPSMGFWGVPCGSAGKESACNVGVLGSISGVGRSPGEGNGNPLQYSCLGNPMDGGAWWVTVHGVAKSLTWPSTGATQWRSFPLLAPESLLSFCFGYNCLWAHKGKLLVGMWCLKGRLKGRHDHKNAACVWK